MGNWNNNHKKRKYKCLANADECKYSNATCRNNLNRNSVINNTTISSATWTLRSVLAMVYLAVFGSVVGYVAYSYLMTQMSSTKVSGLSYVNVVVALFLGWFILDETITPRIILAASLIIGGVFIVNYKKSK